MKASGAPEDIVKVVLVCEQHTPRKRQAVTVEFTTSSRNVTIKELDEAMDALRMDIEEKIKKLESSHKMED